MPSLDSLDVVRPSHSYLSFGWYVNTRWRDGFPVFWPFCPDRDIIFIADVDPESLDVPLGT